MNAGDRQIQPLYQFGPYLLDADEYRLFRNNAEVVLRAKVLDLLVLLVKNAGHVLTKTELLDALWPDSIVEESNLTVTLTELRKALGEGPYIETVARRGYRFTAEVTSLQASTRKSGPSARQPTAFPKPGPPGGALPLHSNLYIKRCADEEFQTAIQRQDSIVLVKGARQVGKTSLLARALQQARMGGFTVVLSDLQRFTSDEPDSLERLLLLLGEQLADSLNLATFPQDRWNSSISASVNFERYLRREVMAKASSPLVWAMDEVDRLFSHTFSLDFFALLRSWHNLRALEPDGPWVKLTLALSYATEAHLFISDFNQSPFNVGTRLLLEDFTFPQVVELNRCYGSPLNNADVQSYFDLVGGHPYLAQCGLYKMATARLSLAEISAQSDKDEGLFGDHLRRMLLPLERDAGLCNALRSVLANQPGLDLPAFYRLRTAGILAGNSPQNAKLRCGVYAAYLKRKFL